jgi:hypothetical protein
MRSRRQQESASRWTPPSRPVLQRKCACGQHAGGGQCEECRRQGSPETSAVGEALRSAGRPLTAEVRDFMEQRIGHDFSRVRVHTDELAARSARSVNALAYTVGSDVVFGAGRYAPETSAGRRLLAHELTHVAQQGGEPGAIRDLGALGEGAEREADGVARAVDGVGLPPSRLSAVPGGLQRAPATEESPSHGSTLPYREATELAKCVQIMGKDSEDHCRAEVLGEKVDERSSTRLKRAAQQQHLDQQKRVADLIRQGLGTAPVSSSATDPQTLFRNSCEWIAQGKSTMAILTPIHDAQTRKPGFVAYFDREVKFPQTGGDYAEQPEAGDTDHILYAPPDWAGGMQGGELSLINPAKFSDAGLKGTIVHEVQHAADQNAFGQAGRVEGTPGVTGGDALQSAQRYNDYQSEFRAYWLQAPEGSPRDKFGSSQQLAQNGKPVVWTDPSAQQKSMATGFANARQERIFWYLHDHYPGLRVAETYATDPSYRAMVNAFAHPAGVNLVNSVRVQNLIKAIEALVTAKGGAAKTSPPADPGKVNDLFQKVAALDETDRAFLEDPVGSQAFWDFAQRSLPFAAFNRLRRMFRQPAVGDFPPDPSWPRTDRAPA